jgi:hypothetical protein
MIERKRILAGREVAGIDAAQPVRFQVAHQGAVTATRLTNACVKIGGLPFLSSSPPKKRMPQQRMPPAVAAHRHHRGCRIVGPAHPIEAFVITSGQCAQHPANALA